MRRAAIALSTLLLLACSAPPQKEIDGAQGAIDAARAAGADQYAPDAFTAATTAMQQTHEAVQQRDYRLALSRAVDAKDRALQAAREAADGKARAQSDADRTLTHATASAQQLDQLIKAAEAARVPARDLEPARRLRAEAERALQEARAATSAGNYHDSTRRVASLPAMIMAEMRGLNEAMESRAGRGTRRRR